MSRIISILTLRLVLGLFLLAGSVTKLFDLPFYTANPDSLKPWITDYSLAGTTVAIIMFLFALALLAGIATVQVALLTATAVCLNHVLLLIKNPFYNTFHHSVPFLLMAAGLAILSNSNKSSKQVLSLYTPHLSVTEEKLGQWLMVLARLFAGTLFFSQGLYSITKQGIFTFAESLYVAPYKGTFIPEAMLWTMGVLNPLIELIGGLMLVVGLKTKMSAVVLACFLGSIVVGHLIADPYESTGDLSNYGLNNLAFVLVILLLYDSYKKYSVDYLLHRR